MPLPDIINDVLTRHDLTLCLTEILPETQRREVTRSTLLQDGEGRLQVIYKANYILDIDALNQLTGRSLVATPAAEVESICSNAQLQRVPSIPHLLGLTVMIDQHLLEADQLVLDSGSEQRMLKLNSKQFVQLLCDARSGDFAVSAAELQAATLDSTDDLEDITHALANFTQLRIKHRLEETLDFPPLPETAQRIIKLRADPHADINDLSDIIESDPPLAAQVVSWAASPYYAAPGKIKSVHDAIMRVLGFDLVLNLALGLSLDKVLSLPKDSAKGYTPYWQQAVYMASAVETLVKLIPVSQRPVIGMAYLSGLLHNFGYLILAQVFPPHFSTYCRYQEANPHANHDLIERHLLGVTREQLGAWLMRSWDMPEEVSTALRHQHDGNFALDHAVYANLLFIAQQLLRKYGIGNAPHSVIPDALYENIQLNPEEAESAIAAMMESAEQLNIMANNLAA